MRNIAVLAGDGIGPEIMVPTVDVLRQVGNFDFDYRFIGGSAINEYGTPLPEATIDACQQADAVLLGAVGGPEWDSAPVRPEQGLLGLRKVMNVHANLRPIRAMPSLHEQTPFKPEVIVGTDFVIVRELLGGSYFGDKGQDKTGTYDVCHYSDQQITAIARTALELAQQRTDISGLEPLVTSVDKANIMETSQRWRSIITNIQQEEYPDTLLNHMLVDAAAYALNMNPRQFNVIVTENMFGDILSDQAASIIGSIGMLASASLNNKGQGLFEPAHGSAPDIVGKDIANPSGMMLSAALALRYCLGMPREAKAIEDAVEATIDDVRTRDIGGNASTTEFSNTVMSKLR